MDTRNQCAKRLKRDNVDAHEDCSAVGTRLAHRAVSRSRLHAECGPGSRKDVVSDGGMPLPTSGPPPLAGAD